MQKRKRQPPSYRQRKGYDQAIVTLTYSKTPSQSGSLARCTPRNQTQTPAKRRAVCNACNTPTLDLAS